jgi:hypothetical protein
LADEPKSNLTSENIAALNQNVEAPQPYQDFESNPNVYKEPAVEPIKADIPPQPVENIVNSSSPAKPIKQPDIPKVKPVSQQRLTSVVKPPENILPERRETEIKVHQSGIFSGALPIKEKPNLFSTEEEDDAPFMPQIKENAYDAIKNVDVKASLLYEEKKEDKSSQNKAKELLESIKKSIVLKPVEKAENKPQEENIPKIDNPSPKKEVEIEKKPEPSSNKYFDPFGLAGNESSNSNNDALLSKPLVQKNDIAMQSFTSSAKKEPTPSANTEMKSMVFGKKKKGIFEDDA